MANESPVQVDRVNEEVPAQVAPPREPDADKVTVNETNVALDRVITDPASPEAVQVPEEGKGSLDLPIHGVAGTSTPEDRLADSSEEEVSADDRAEAAAKGETVGSEPRPPEPDE